MDWIWKKAGCVMLIFLAGAAGVPGEEPAPAEEEIPLMTLDTSSIRSLLKLGGKGTDIRLKVQRPTSGSLSVLQDEWFIQGVEFRLPMKGMWVGVEKDLGEDVRRATLSLKRTF
jgi:hypothetical protein